MTADTILSDEQKQYLEGFLSAVAARNGGAGGGGTPDIHRIAQDHFIAAGKQLSAEELAAEVKSAIAAAGAKSPKEMGAVMKILMPKVQGQAEGKAISDEVKAQLAKLV